jgi:hypothetical protein
MARKKSPSNQYFNEKIEQAIVDYNAAKTQLERDKLFLIIYPAIYKIAEVMFNKIKPEYIEGEPTDIMLDCVCYLSERLFRIKTGKGKAFSYMTVCARNYYIFHNQRGYTGTKKTLKLDALNQNWDIADDDSQRGEEMETIHNITTAFAKYLDDNKDNILANDNQKSFLKQIIDCLLNAENYNEDFNERAFLNELTANHPKGTSRPAIRKLLNRLAVHYSKFKKEFLETGEPIKFYFKNRLTPDELEFCLNNFKQNDRRYGAIALGKRFSIDEYLIRKQLAEYGLCSIG